MTQNDRTPDDADALPDAGRIIDLFGGIRPMASKMGVPVTTVQGWKKRDVIPGNRRHDVMDAARTYGINLGDVAAGDARFADSMRQAGAEQSANPAATRAHEDALEAARKTDIQESLRAQVASLTRQDMIDEIRKAQKTTEIKAARRSMVASVALLSVFGLVFGMMITVHRQQLAEQKRQLQIMEQEIQSFEEKAENQGPGAMRGMIDDMTRKFSDLRQKTEEIQASVHDLKSQAETLMNLDNGALLDRVMALETKVGGIPGGGDLSAMMGRLAEMQNSMEGQAQMQATVEKLKSLVLGADAQDPEAVDAALLAEQAEGDSELAQTLEGVSPEQVKAAALLIGLSQFRDSMNRSGPFIEDLALLQSMLGDKDPELNAAIAQLAPYAEKGVLSPKGLSNELKTLTGEIVVASITGQDVSVQERAMARFQEVLNIQKNGEPIMGTDTQARVARAQVLLDSGQVDAAITELNGLEGPAKEKAQPIIDQAEITKMAQEMQGLLAGGVMSKVKTGISGIGGVAKGGQGVPYVVSPGLNIPGMKDVMGPKNFTPIPQPEP